MIERDINQVGRLDEQLCFQLYLASRRFVRAYQPLLEEIGITYPQYLVMIVLWEKKKVSIKELGQDLDLDSGTLSPLIKRMIEKGLLKKTRDPEDERGVMISLTESGLKLKDKAQCVPSQLLTAIGVDLAELLALIDPLKELNRQLENA